MGRSGVVLLCVVVTPLAISACSSSTAKPDGGTGAAGTSASGIAGNAAGGTSGAGSGGSGGSMTGGSGGSATSGSGGTASGGQGGSAGSGASGASGSGTGGAGGGVDGSVWDQVDASSDGVLEYLHQQVDAARNVWAQSKGSCTTYNYDRVWISLFSGAADLTEVEIQSDVATRRRFSTGAMLADGGIAWTPLWDETGSAVGQHGTQSPAFPASTMEQLFSECETILARDPAAYYLDLQLDPNRGIPLRCTYRPKNCVDDCTFGITIQSFSCTPLSSAGSN